MTRLGLILRLSALLVVVSAWWWLPVVLRPLSFFAVRRVDVIGARYFDPAAVVAAMALRPGASVFDSRRAVEQTLESVPGVAEASVTRVLPGTLRVRITEVEPVALAEGPDGLVALGRDARPLPYDVARSPVDAPIVNAAEAPLLEALNEVQATDPGLFADVASARITAGDVVLDMTQGRVRLDLPVDRRIVESVSAVRRDLAARDVEWRELDGRFRGWVVVRRAQVSGVGGQTRPAAPRNPAPGTRNRLS